MPRKTREPGDRPRPIRNPRCLSGETGGRQTLEPYIRDPVAIEEQSFRLIRAHTDLTPFNDSQQQVVMRLVHTCGNPDVAGLVRFSARATEAGVDALSQRAPVLCDVEMVRHGLTRRYLESPVHCFLNHEDVAQRARERGETRSMTALDHWQPHMDGAIAIIGNAPTALFRLLEMMEDGAPRPALVIGMPVGFVGAPESKQHLWDRHGELGLECITLDGRVGGSALAAGTFNTLLRLQRGLRF